MSDETSNPEDTETTEEQVFDITTASEAELRERAAELKAKIEDIGQAESLAQATELAELRSERNSIVEAVNETMRLRAETSDAEITEPVVEEPAEEPKAEVEAEVEDTATDVADTPAEEPKAEAQPAPAGTQPQPVVETVADESADVVAAAEAVLEESAAVVAGASDRPTAPSGPAYTRPRAAYVAGAGQTAYGQGQELNDSELGRAWESMRTSLRPGPNGRTRAVVANLRAFDDEMPVEALSKSNSIEHNDRLIQESRDAWRAKRRGEMPPAHTAAICDPLDIIREIPYGGELDTPFNDLFPQRPISRLGFQYTTASALSVAASGVTLWTESDQTSVDIDDSSTWKPSVLIECSTPAEIKAEELVTVAEVDNSTEMSSPERVAEFMHKLAVARAREKEQYILGLFDATASPYTLTGDFGAVASLIQAVHTVLPQLLYGERLGEEDYDLVVDPGYFNKLVIDENSKCELSADDVKAKLQKEIGLNLVVLRDFVSTSPFQTPPTPGGSAAALQALPTANRVRIVPAGAYIYGSTGEQATGWQTDPQLARMNRMQAFSQEWLLLAKHGEHPAAYIDVSSAHDGSRGGCVTPS